MARSRPRARLPRRTMLASLVAAAFAASPAMAQTPPAPNQLPIAAANWLGSGQAASATAGSAMTITQQSLRAILNWHSFDIGSQASVHFNHLQGSAAATLNRIGTANPTQIFGKLTANGQVYLYNQNGIIFGNGAQVNVGSLVASTLNISDALFEQQFSTLTGVQPVFQWDAAGGIDPATSLVRIDAGANLGSAEGGRILVFAPTVVNNGTIRTPGGQAALAAGEKVYLAASTSPVLRGLLVEVDAFEPAPGQTLSQVVNDRLGQIVAERGNVTLAALAVNQSGRVSATTSVNLNGSIRLLARDKAIRDAGNLTDELPIGSRTGTLVLGEGSVTEVLPDAADDKVISDQQTFTPSRVELVGRTVTLERGALVRATSGEVDIAAQQGAQIFVPPELTPVPGVGVYLQEGARIDVSGLRDVLLPMESNVIEVELRGNELRDSPLQRDGPLRNQKVRVDVRKGTPLADVSGQIAQIGRGIREKSTAGGIARIRSEGELVLEAGASVDVSGGSIRFLDGYIDTTKLASPGGIVDIGEADPDRLYFGIIDTYSVTYGRWGVTDTFRPLGRGRFERGYVEGKDAGTAEFVSRSLTLDGMIHGHTVSGVRQRELSAAPLAGRLVVGNAAGSGGDYKTPDVVLLQAGIAPLDGEVALSLDRLRAGGVDRIAVYSEGRIRIAPGSDVSLAQGGSLLLTGREIDVSGDIRVPAGEIRLVTRGTPTSTTDATRQQLRVAEGVTLDARGGWVNDDPRLPGGTRDARIAIDGGSVTLDSVADLILGAGSLIDVSGGGYLASDGAPRPGAGDVSAGSDIATVGTLRAGTGGDIALTTGRFNLADGAPEAHRLLLGGELRAYGIEKGGTLSLRTSEVAIGTAAPATARQLVLDPGFFQRGGFASYDVTGGDALAVLPGTSVYAATENPLLDSGYALQPTGSDLYDFSAITRLPDFVRAAASVSLRSTASPLGETTIGEGAEVAVDPGGSITVESGGQLTVLGTLSAPGGRIRLASAPPGELESFNFDPGQSIWLGARSRLLAGGTFVAQPDTGGLRLGTVYDGGSVSIEARRGYLVAERGALIDVSGASAVLDLPAGTALEPRREPVSVASHAGSVSLSAREGLLFDGTFAAQPGGEGARGGALSATLDLPTSILGFPVADRVLALGGFDAVVPEGLAPGEAIDTATFNGRGWIDLERVAAGGFDALSLRVSNGVNSGDSAARVELSGSGTASLRSRIEIDAPVVASTGGDFGLHAAYVSLAHNDIQRQRERGATGGTGSLQVQAGVVDIGGNVTLQGFGDVRFESAGDLRLRGVQDNSAALPDDEQGRRLAGGLYSGADRLTFRAAQVYPTTLSEFTIALRGSPDGVIRFEGAGSPRQPLSAGGTLTVSAPYIEQAGALHAPFGTISLDAASRLSIEAGSLTSVSGAGATIPLGRTELSGGDWVYALGVGINRIFDTPPEKRIALAAPEVSVEAGARLDVSGGGELYAYEFQAGPGGSRDVLDPAFAPDTYAILPGLDAGSSPYDPLYREGVSGLAEGGLVWLSAGGGLAAGYYRLLPARYALLPGAHLVTARADSTDLLPGQASANPDGSRIVAGYFATRTLDGALLRDARTRGFDVRPGALARTKAEYRDTFAGDFFVATAGAQLPRDSGRLAVAAGQSLALLGNLSTAAGSGGRGAEVDISATRLAVVGGGDAPGGLNGFVILDAAQLRALGADSLFLGGTRRVEEGASRLAVTADEVRIINSQDDALTAPELIVAARDSVLVGEGSVVGSSEGFRGSARDLRVDGDGALLRVSTANQVRLLRGGVGSTRGSLVVEESAEISAGKSMILDATAANRVDGVVMLGDGAALHLGAERISAGVVPAGTSGLVLSDATFSGLPGLAELTLRSYSSFDLHGAAAFGSAALESLSIEAGGIAGHGAAGTLATLTARTVTLANPNGTPFATAEGTGSLAISAERIVLGQNSFAMGGFAASTLAAGEIVAAGDGALAAQGTLRLEAGRIGAEGGASYRIAASGSLETALPAAAPALPASDTVGGRLTLEGAQVVHRGRIELPSGSVELRATAGDVVLETGSSIVAASAVRTYGERTLGSAAGSVALVSSSGNVHMQEGASLDVRGLAGGDAGTVRLEAASGSVSIEGTLLGGAEAGVGDVPPLAGSAIIDAASLGEFSSLNERLNAGGFAQRIEARARGGDLAVAAGETVVAHEVHLSADAGSVTVAGAIDARGTKGGDIRLHGANGARLASGSRLDASSSTDAASVVDANGLPFGSRGQGGTVLVAASGGTGVEVGAGAVIDVSSAGPAANGSVTLRAPRTGVAGPSDAGTGVLMSPFAGTVIRNASGAAPTLAVEATKLYEAASVNATTLSTINSHNGAFVTAMSGVALGEGFVLRPGVEIRSAGDMTLASDLSFHASRPGGQPGTLTLRAGGNLLLNGSLSDGFTAAATTATLLNPAGPSWSYRLVGGADLAAAAPLATVRDAGDVRLAAGKLVRTGTGSIEIAAGRDFSLAAQSSVVYTAGARSPVVTPFTVAPIGGVQAEFGERGGDIAIQAGRHIVAAGTNQLVNDWLYRQGRVDGVQFAGEFRNVAWWPRYLDFQQGIGALAGGDVRVSAGGDIESLSVSTSSVGRLPGNLAGGSPASGLDVRGGGDVNISAAGDIGSAIVYVDRGLGRITAGGSIASSRTISGDALDALLALGEARLLVQAGRDVRVETVFNPMIVQQAFGNVGGAAFRNRSYFLNYGPDAAVDLRAGAGDVSLENRIDTGALIGAFGTSLLTAVNDRGALVAYPGTLRAVAAGGDVSVGGAFFMAPSPNGTLELLAHDDVAVSNAMFMADVSPAALPAPASPDFTLTDAIQPLLLSRSYQSARFHSDPPLHADDPEPVRIAAISGDVLGPDNGSTPLGIFAKPVLVTAGRDVRNAYFVAQNLRASDVTRVSAGRDVTFDLRRSQNGDQQGNAGRFDLGGPGRLEVLAGRHVDFGNSSGAVTRGNLFNPFLPEGGASILVQAGFGQAEYPGFIDAYLPSYGTELTAYMRRLTGDATLSDVAAARLYAALPADRRIEFANQMLYAELRASGREAGRTSGGLDRYARGFAAIDKLFPATTQGDISLFFSQVKTEQGGDIDLMAPGGLVNAGLANPGAIAKDASDLGILTIRGGSIRSYVRDDFAVNQSRVFTLGGGDILIWSSFGDIDAGRGAKTASATPPPQIVIRDDQIELDTTNSVSGSGIGVLLATEGIEPGDVDLIAPRGEVNAGDAGIRVAGNLNIAALRVVGADNIQVGGLSTGVPVVASTGAIASLAASAGSAAAAATQGAADLARGGGSQDAFRPSFITVKILGFGS